MVPLSYRCKEICLPCHRISGSTVLRWELEHTLLKIGYQLTVSQQTCHIHRDNNAVWKARLQLLGIGSADMGIPRTQLLKKGMVTSVATSSEVYWLTTRALLCLLLHWQIKRKEIEHRQLAAAIGRLLLAKTFDFSKVTELPFDSIPAACAEKCTIGPVQDGKCACASRCFLVPYPNRK